MRIFSKSQRQSEDQKIERFNTLLDTANRTPREEKETLQLSKDLAAQQRAKRSKKSETAEE